VEGNSKELQKNDTGNFTKYYEGDQIEKAEMN
jgi:hypothetical protein